MIHYGSVFRKREAYLMEICNWEGMSDDKWTSVLKVLTYKMFCPLKSICYCRSPSLRVNQFLFHVT